MAQPDEAGGPESDTVRKQLLHLIEATNWTSGERLGSERELAVSLGVGRSAVRLALASLERAGLVRRVPGRGGGTFVGHRKVERNLSQILGVPALLRAQGMTAGSRIVSTGMRVTDEATAVALELLPGDYVLDIVRIRLADGAPISLERATLPAHLFAGLLDLPLGGSLYDLLAERYGVRPDEAVEQIEVVAATGDQAPILDIAPGAPLLSITRTTRDFAGVVFEHSHDLFRADRTRISVRTDGHARRTVTTQTTDASGFA